MIGSRSFVDQSNTYVEVQQAVPCCKLFLNQSVSVGWVYLAKVCLSCHTLPLNLSLPTMFSLTDPSILCGVTTLAAAAVGFACGRRFPRPVYVEARQSLANNIYLNVTCRYSEPSQVQQVQSSETRAMPRVRRVIQRRDCPSLRRIVDVVLLATDSPSSEVSLRMPYMQP